MSQAQAREMNENSANAKAQLAKPRLSSRGGTYILRSVSLFLAGGRKASKSTHATGPGTTTTATATATDNATPGSGANAKRCGRRNMSDEHAQKNSSKCTARLLEAMRRDTHFTKDEIDALYKIYKKLVASSKTNMVYMNSGTIGLGPPTISKSNKIHEGVDRIVFQELLHNTFDLVTEDTLMDRIFCAWDKNNEGLLKVEMWLAGLSVFLRGTFDQKIRYCFRVYDLNSDGFISKDEMFQLLKNCLVKQPQEEDPDEGVRDLVEIVLRKLDADKDGKVSFEDYESAVKREPLLLEAFGQCLPTEGACITFLSTLQV